MSRRTVRFSMLKRMAKGRKSLRLYWSKYILRYIMSCCKRERQIPRFNKNNKPRDNYASFIRDHSPKVLPKNDAAKRMIRALRYAHNRVQKVPKES